ncbi:MAG: ABC transporter substrate-binding protein [Desulfobacterales bacterium]|nr:ABC transporter substrate-binding protein [Desulfobacterales bacterium]
MAEKPVIRVGHIKITDHLILGVTKHKLEKGEEALQYSTMQTECKNGWHEVDSALREGEIDAAFILAPMAFDLYSSGQKIKLVLFGHKNGSTLIKNKRANIGDIKDFKGKTIIIPYQLSIHNMLLHQMLSKQGLQAGAGHDVLLEVFAPVQIPEAIQYDEEGDIGGFIVAEPFGSQVVKEGYGEEMAMSKDLWPNHPCCVFVVKEEIVGKYPDAVHELVTSLVKSGKFVQEDWKAAAEIGASFLGQKPEVMERVLTQPEDRIRTDELFPIIDDLGVMQDYMADEMKLLKTKIDLEKLVDPQFAKAAGAV